MAGSMWIIGSVLISLQIVDITTTYYCVMVLGFEELNPVADYLIREFGFWEGLVVFKMIFTSALLWFLKIYFDRRNRLREEG